MQDRERDYDAEVKDKEIEERWPSFMRAEKTDGRPSLALDRSRALAIHGRYAARVEAVLVEAESKLDEIKNAYEKEIAEHEAKGRR